MLLFLSGLYLDERGSSNDIKKYSFFNVMNTLLEKNNIFLSIDSPDNHLCMMLKANNLLGDFHIWDIYSIIKIY